MKPSKKIIYTFTVFLSVATSALIVQSFNLSHELKTKEDINTTHISEVKQEKVEVLTVEATPEKAAQIDEKTISESQSTQKAEQPAVVKTIDDITLEELYSKTMVESCTSTASDHRAYSAGNDRFLEIVKESIKNKDAILLTNGSDGGKMVCVNYQTLSLLGL